MPPPKNSVVAITTAEEFEESLKAPTLSVVHFYKSNKQTDTAKKFNTAFEGLCGRKRKLCFSRVDFSNDSVKDVFAKMAVREIPTVVCFAHGRETRRFDAPTVAALEKDHQVAATAAMVGSGVFAHSTPAGGGGDGSQDPDGLTNTATTAEAAPVVASAANLNMSCSITEGPLPAVTLPPSAELIAEAGSEEQAKLLLFLEHYVSGYRQRDSAVNNSLFSAEGTTPRHALAHSSPTSARGFTKGPEGASPPRKESSVTSAAAQPQNNNKTNADKPPTGKQQRQHPQTSGTTPGAPVEGDVQKTDAPPVAETASARQRRQQKQEDVEFVDFCC